MSQADPTPSKSAQAPGFYRFRVGAFDLVALHDGVLVRDRPPGFVRNATDEEVGEAFAAAGMARDKLTLTFNALAIDTGHGLVLVDTGLGPSGPPGTGALAGNLRAAGYRPEDVAKVIISHFHLDHISGLLDASGRPAYPNADLLVPEPEWAFWTDEAARSQAPAALQDGFALVDRVFAAAPPTRRFAWGEELVPGITAIDAAGHTPGMTALEIKSGGQAAMFVADVTNNPLVFARHPEWQAMFDIDPQRATATRRRLLDRAAAEKLRLCFYHAPFPATGTIVASGNGYEYLPALWTAG